ncbi:hypothetical protein CRENBAI_012265, partial [Crenichthys baileyi]
QTGRRGKERGRHSAKVAGSGTRTRDGRFEDYSLYMWSRANPYTTSDAPSPTPPAPRQPLHHQR